MKRLNQNSPRIDKFFSKKNKKENSDSSSEEEAKNTKSKTMKSTASNLVKKTSSRPAAFLSLESSINDKTMQVYKDDKFVCIRGNIVCIF